MSEESNQYILGTEKEELLRLGLQHQVWSSEARKGWEIGEFSTGQTIVDLGSGPGYCTFDLGYIVGEGGRIIAVDKSKNYIDFIEEQNKLHGLNIQTMHCDFDDLKLPENSIDAVYCRWALAWIPNPEEILEKLTEALVPGGAMVIQEYFDWSTFQTEPHYPMLAKGIETILQSFFDGPGNINIGKSLPGMFYDLDMEVMSIRPLSKMATPEDLTWQWPETFLKIYMPKLIQTGTITEAEVKQALDEFQELKMDAGATILCPQMVEVVAVKM